jgi:hypothetical protein
MCEMLAVARRLGARAYGGGIADGPPVRGVRARTAALALGLLGTGCVGAWGSSQTVNSGLQLIFQVFPLKIGNAKLHESCVPHQDLQLS